MKICLLPGDGIGVEIVDAAVEVLDAAAKKYGFEIEGTGKKYALRNGEYVDAYYMARVK
mgnify:CR=1 FL=1